MLIRIDQLPRVPLEEMNQIHYREVELLNHLFQSIEAFEDGKVDLDYIKAVYQEFIDDVVSHFSFENQMMEESNFFAYNIHREEHDIVLFQLKSVQKSLEDRGDVEMLKDYLVYTFKPWIFPIFSLWIQ